MPHHETMSLAEMEAAGCCDRGHADHPSDPEATRLRRRHNATLFRIWQLGRDTGPVALEAEWRAAAAVRKHEGM